MAIARFKKMAGNELLDWEEEEGGPWIPYSEYISGHQEEMLDLFQIPGPGPPAFQLVVPPPPPPECSQITSHFATCPSRLEVSLSIC